MGIDASLIGAPGDRLEGRPMLVLPHLQRVRGADREGPLRVLG